VIKSVKRDEIIRIQNTTTVIQTRKFTFPELEELIEKKSTAALSLGKQSATALLGPATKEEAELLPTLESSDPGGSRAETPSCAPCHWDR
jgi:hypothetical protein